MNYSPFQEDPILYCFALTVKYGLQIMVFHMFAFTRMRLKEQERLV